MDQGARGSNRGLNSFITEIRYLLLPSRDMTARLFTRTNMMAAVTPTNRPTSVRNRCVIGVLGGVLCCQLVGFRHRTESDPVFFSLKLTKQNHSNNGKYLQCLMC